MARCCSLIVWARGGGLRPGRQGASELSTLYLCCCASVCILYSSARSNAAYYSIRGSISNAQHIDACQHIPSTCTTPPALLVSRERNAVVNEGPARCVLGRNYSNAPPRRSARGQAAFPLAGIIVRYGPCREPTDVTCYPADARVLRNHQLSLQGARTSPWPDHTYKVFGAKQASKASLAWTGGPNEVSAMAKPRTR